MLRLSSRDFSSHQVDGEDIETVKMVESESLEESDYASNIIVSEVPVETLLGESIIEETTVKETWLEAPTRLFIKLLLEMQPNLGKTYELKNKNKMLERCQKILANEGYPFNIKQVSGKYRTMERKYRLAKERQPKPGKKRKLIPFEKEMDRLFGEVKECPDILNSEERDPSTGTVVYTPIPKKVRMKGGTETNHLKILKKLDEIAKEKAQFHEKMLQRLERKEKMEEERNELLKRIASSFENNFSS